MSQEAMNAMDSEPHLKTSSKSPERTTGRFSESLPPARQIINVNNDSCFSVEMHRVWYFVVFFHSTPCT